jgi:hypothetical protein
MFSNVGEMLCEDCGTTVGVRADGAPGVHLAGCGRLCWNAPMATLSRVLAKAGRRHPARDLLHTPACPRCAERTLHI